MSGSLTGKSGRGTAPGLGRDRWVSVRGLDICREALTSGAARALMAQADAYHESLYGHADQLPMAPADFQPCRQGVFLVAYLNGYPVACGGLRQAEPTASAGSGEVKRMFVVKEARRRGLGRLLLTALEEEARRFGYPRMVVDVGGKQAGAHGMYEACGYQRIPGFTFYDVPGYSREPGLRKVADLSLRAELPTSRYDQDHYVHKIR